MTKNPDRRVLRNSPDAEASILGGIILRNELLAALGELEIDDFYDHRHKVVFAAMRNLEATWRPIDIVTLENEIEKLGKLESIGGVAFLGLLALRVPTPDNVLAYAEIVRGDAMVRRLAIACGELLDATYDPAHEPRELLERATSELGRIERKRGDETASIGELARRRIAELEDLVRRRADGENALSGVPTGVADLDREVGGWQLGVVNVIAARPGMGKSALTIATAEACAELGYGVHVFSLEDSWRTYIDRCLARRSGVPAAAIRRGDLDGKREGVIDFVRVLEASGLYSHTLKLRWLVDDMKGLSANDIIASVRRAKKELGTRVVIVDYLHLIKRNPRLGESEALDEIMTLFSQSVQPDEAWVVPSQLNRKVEERTDKRPQLADLRGSGAIEERAKLIVGLYRGSYYGDEPIEDVDYTAKRLDKLGLKFAEWKDEQWRREVQCLVLKNSNGRAPATVFAEWTGSTTRIS